MSLRALWIISGNSYNGPSLFSRYFPSVEDRCKSIFGDSYTCIPPEKSLLKSIFHELYLNKSNKFEELRDGSNKSVIFPAFQIHTENGILWPLIVMEDGALYYCALPLVTNFKTMPQSSFFLVDLPCVSMAISILNGLMLFVKSTHFGHLQSTESMSELVEYVSISLPFGRPITCDVSIANNLINSTTTGKVKHPVWNSTLHKGKAQVKVSVQEEIRCIQYNNPNAHDTLDVYGVISCMPQVEGSIPEILLQFSHSETVNSEFIINSAVNSIDKKSTTTRLRFQPCNDEPLFLYSISSLFQPPIQGIFKLTKTDGAPYQVYVQLKLNNKIKNLFRQLEVHIQLQRHIKNIKSKQSVGNTKVRSSNILVWNIGSKFPTSSLEAVLNCMVKLAKQKPKSEDDDIVNISEEWSNLFAKVMFEIDDFTYSDLKFDSQTVLVSTSPKVQSSFSTKFISGTYKIFNSAGELTTTNTNFHSEALHTFLSQQ